MKAVADKETMPVYIRWMVRRDVPDVLEAEEESFNCPWSENDFICCLRHSNCIGMVAEHNERVVGFMFYELYKKRPFHILNFVVCRDVRRLGIGQQMVDNLVCKLSNQRRTRITVDVRETNLPAQLFFRNSGFRAASVLHKSYADTPEDIIRMIYELPMDCEEQLDGIASPQLATEILEKVDQQS